MQFSENVIFLHFGWDTSHAHYVVSFYFKGQDPDGDINFLVIPIVEWNIIRKCEKDLERTALFFLMSNGIIVPEPEYLS